MDWCNIRFCVMSHNVSFATKDQSLGEEVFLDYYGGSGGLK